jgi:Protein of unknown function (DUF4446)
VAGIGRYDTSRSHPGRRFDPRRCPPLSDLNRVLANNLALILGAVALLLAVALAWLALQTRRLSQAMTTYRSLVGDEQGSSLADVLKSHLARVEVVATRLDDLVVLAEHLELRSRGSLQHVGLVRFNPFDDTGSDQSFAIALLDQRRDGIVISSLHGRGTTRLFAKPVEGGISNHTLSAEEAEAIRIALAGTGPVPTVS